MTLSFLETPWEFFTELKRLLRLPHRKLSLDTEKWENIFFIELIMLSYEDLKKNSKVGKIYKFSLKARY